MIQNAAPELVTSEIEAMIGRLAPSAAAAAKEAPEPRLPGEAASSTPD
jgi:hypothetical protein